MGRHRVERVTRVTVQTIEGPTVRVFPVVDEDLPHQIVLRFDGVSCNCRVVPNPGRGSDGYVFFAPFGAADACLAAYRDPANHRGAFP